MANTMNRTIRLLSASALATLIASLTATAETPPLPETSRWVNYTNTNTVMGFSPSGAGLWVATTGGLARLASSGSTQPQILTNADGIADNDLRFVLEDDEGRVWTGGTAGRLSRRFSDHDWVIYNFNTSDAPVELLTAAMGPEGFLWVGSSIGLHKFDIDRNGGEIKETYSRLGGWPASSPVRDMLVLDGMIWTVGPAGVARASADDQFLLNPARWQSWGGFPILKAISVLDGVVHVAGDGGLWRFAPAEVDPAESVWVKIGFDDRDISDIVMVGDTIWLATDRGLARCTPTGCVNAPLPGTPLRALTSIAASSDHVIWGGTNGAGVLRYEAGTADLMAFPGPIENQFEDIAVGEDGRVWCVHYSTGAAEFLDQGVWTNLPYYTDVVGDASGTSVDIAPNGDIWLGSWGAGAFRVSNDNPLDDWQRFDTTNSTLMYVIDPVGPNNYVVIRDVSVDPDGRVWFANHLAAMGRVIPYYDNGCWGYYEVADNLISNTPSKLWALENEVLIGFDNVGVADLEYNEPLCVGGQPVNATPVVTYRDSDDGLPADQVLSLLVDRADSLYVGTNVGLSRYTADIRRYTNVPLPAEAGLTVNALAADAANNIWVGTTLGLVMIPTSGEPVFYSPDNSPLVGRNVRTLAVDDRTGYLWIGTTTGLSRFAAGVTTATSIESILAYPNPFVVEGDGLERVRFNAPFGSRIYVYTTDAQPVVDFPSETGWDGRTSGGALVASGVYIFVVRGPDGDHGRGKIAVVRRR